MKDLQAKVLVVLKAAPTYLAVASVVLTVFLEELVALLPDNAAASISAVVVTALVWIAAIVRVISRLTPVAADERGLLPPTSDTSGD